MKILIISLAILILVTGTVGCSGSDAEVDGLGIVREDGGLRVTLNETGAGASTSMIWVDVTVENIGTSSLDDFETYLAAEPLNSEKLYSNKYLYDAFQSVCDGRALQPGEIHNERVQVWNVTAFGSIKWQDQAYVVIRAIDDQGTTLWVDFEVDVKDYSDDWGGNES